MAIESRGDSLIIRLRGFFEYKNVLRPGIAVVAGVSPAILRRRSPRRPRSNLRLHHFGAGRNLPRSQERLNQRAFPAHNQLRKSFEPLTLRNFWLSHESVSKLTELIKRNFPLGDSIEQMVQ